ncbi:hypothetical protein BaRGS_00022410 [Batillaria attramentaria]|uniref:EB domain-containing protein n=1 Tax=Batillaria attramentaria TaxID=370345 RepID=A0ABD0KH64_9CAEN
MPCTSSDQCPMKHSACINDRCICNPGYFYSETNGGCITDCKKPGSDYVEYPQSKLVGHTSLTFYPLGTEPEDCFNKLLEYGSRFVSFDYRFGLKACMLQEVTALMVDPADYEIITATNYVWSHFQRTCA